jgi:hypothetical protein
MSSYGVIIEIQAAPEVSGCANEFVSGEIIQATESLSLASSG